MRRLLPLLLPALAVAHPLGRDEYSLRAGIEADGDGLRVVVMGEIPMAEVITGLGRLAEGKPPTRAHQQAWTRARLDELAASQTLTVDGQALSPTWTPSASAFNGRALDGFFVYVIETRVPAEKLDRDVTVVLQDQAWPDKPMVYHNQARASDGWTVASSTATDDWTEDAGQRTLTVRFTRERH